MRRLLLPALALALGACAVGPDYQPPNIETPANWQVSLAEASPTEQVKTTVDRHR